MSCGKENSQVHCGCKDKADETGREAATGFGIMSIKVTAFADSKVTDTDGNLVNHGNLLK